jgi:pyruvate/2-oxoglutarate dehydrogenase complex dihydrolipoamide acyltransferase (E2) component
VPEARIAIRDRSAQTGVRISFTGWVVKCLAQAVSEHKYIHAVRKGNKQLVIFDDVDVNIVVERAVGEQAAGETLPMLYIIRTANEKNVAEIHAEIRAAQRSFVAAGEVQIASTRAAWITKIGTMLPRFMRELLLLQELMGSGYGLECVNQSQLIEHLN